MTGTKGLAHSCAQPCLLVDLDLLQWNCPVHISPEDNVALPGLIDCGMCPALSSAQVTIPDLFPIQQLSAFHCIVF